MALNLSMKKYAFEGVDRHAHENMIMGMNDYPTIIIFEDFRTDPEMRRQARIRVAAENDRFMGTQAFGRFLNDWYAAENRPLLGWAIQQTNWQLLMAWLGSFEE
jgi:hypothetical protein